MARVRYLLARFGLRPDHAGDPDEREPGPWRDPTGVPAPAHDPTRPAPEEPPEPPEPAEDEVDSWGVDSFPASDPPPGP